jgi:hypothetical protein
VCQKKKKKLCYAPDTVDDKDQCPVFRDKKDKPENPEIPVEKEKKKKKRKSVLIF